jgi:citrate lyase subunit beta-like protein
MYVPGNDDRKVAKIPFLGADCVVLDCEDGVSINKKVIIDAELQMMMA